MSENVGVQIENPLFGRTEIITPVEEITRNNVDTKTLKTKYAELYKSLLKVSSYFKFEVV